ENEESKSDESIDEDVPPQFDETLVSDAFRLDGNKCYHKGTVGGHWASVVFEHEDPVPEESQIELELYPFEHFKETDYETRNLCLVVMPRSQLPKLNLEWSESNIMGSVVYYQIGTFVKVRRGTKTLRVSPLTDEAPEWSTKGDSQGVRMRIAIASAAGKVDFFMNGRPVKTANIDKGQEYVVVLSCKRPAGGGQRLICRCLKSTAPRFSPETDKDILKAERQREAEARRERAARRERLAERERQRLERRRERATPRAAEGEREREREVPAKQGGRKGDASPQVET
ncbi:hypothetical protein KIPB_003330, partial [Kipferlia bialata]